MKLGFTWDPNNAPVQAVLSARHNLKFGVWHCHWIFFADRYSYDSSAVYRFTGLRRLKEDFAWFNREIVTIGQNTNV
jgi:hypothetical protein